MSPKFPFIANEFNGKRILVTGGTAGIGKAVVTRVLDGGAKVITTARKVAKDEEKENPASLEAGFLSLCELLRGG